MAVDRVARLLKKVTGALERARIPYAVVGCNAVAAWVARKDPDAIRNTKDVDLLARRDDVPRMADALRKIGQVRSQANTLSSRTNEFGRITHTAPRT